MAGAPDDLVRATYLATRTSGFGRTVSRYLREMFRGANPGAPQYVLRDTELGQLTQAVTVVMGEEDLMQPASEVADRVSRLTRGRLARVPGGHEPWLDDIDACADVVVGALSAASKPVEAV